MDKYIFNICRKLFRVLKKKNNKKSCIYNLHFNNNNNIKLKFCKKLRT